MHYAQISSYNIILKEKIIPSINEEATLLLNGKENESFRLILVKPVKSVVKTLIIKIHYVKPQFATNIVNIHDRLGGKVCRKM